MAPVPLIVNTPFSSVKDRYIPHVPLQQALETVDRQKHEEKDLREVAGLTTNTIAKMSKGDDVSTQVLRKICKALGCKIEDIVDLG